MNIGFFPFMVPLLVGAFIQSIKVIIDMINDKTLNLTSFWRAGGFPSVHSGVSGSITMLVGLMQGFDSLLFAVTISFSFLFWYDAMNVRYEAGKHAQYINELSAELKNILAMDARMIVLKERLGHTRKEVLGGIAFGAILTFMIRYFFI